MMSSRCCRLHLTIVADPLTRFLDLYMLMSELLVALQKNGITARHWHVRHLIAAGAIAAPRRDSTGRFRFSSSDVKTIQARLLAMRSYRKDRPTDLRQGMPQ